MTSSEFQTRFTELLNPANSGNLELATTFMQEVLADYNNAQTTTTTLNTLKEQITTKDKEISNLKQTNFNLFMTLGNQTNNEPGSSSTPPDPEPPSDPDSAVVGLDDLISMLVPKKGE